MTRLRKTVTLAFDRRLALSRTYRIAVNGTAPDGLVDTSGRLFDGNSDGQPGGNYLGQFNGRKLAGRSQSGT